MALIELEKPTTAAVDGTSGTPAETDQQHLHQDIILTTINTQVRHRNHRPSQSRVL